MTRNSLAGRIAAAVFVAGIGAGMPLLAAGPAPAQGMPGQGMPGQGMPDHGAGHGMVHGTPAPAAVQDGSGHAGHAATAAAPAADTPAVAAYRAGAAQMHRDMDIAYSGDPDVDFVRGMIPHHAGAVAMARTVLAFGKDPQIRKLAEEVVKAQEAEIAFMQAWLAKNAGATSPAAPAK